MAAEVLGRVDPLESVDLHAPLGPLGDRESSIQRRQKKCKKLKKPKRISSPRDEVGSNQKSGTRKEPVLLADLKIALRGRPQASLARKEGAWDKDRSE
jgi:hypothetical protein